MPVKPPGLVRRPPRTARGPESFKTEAKGLELLVGQENRPAAATR